MGSGELMLAAPRMSLGIILGDLMSVRISLAVGAGLFVVACGNSGNAAAQGRTAKLYTAGMTATTNWSDANLDAAKVDYFFKTMSKFTDYQIAHPDFDLDAVSMDGNESEADYAKRMNADPKLRQVFVSTGIDPAHYANAAGLLIGAMFGVGIAGKLAPSKMPQAAQYYLAHKSEIDSKMGALRDKAKAMAKQTGEDDQEN